tara:strand:- start:2399 stop:3100 length:702 start_codon:yes stop_codon:yes gene_type:complete
MDFLGTNDKEINFNESDKDYYVKFTFYIAYALLVTTATVTFIEAITNKDPKVRHILNLETCISVVATYFYGRFIQKINTQNQINYKDININRYLDWSITTPIMLLVLILTFSYTLKSKVRLFDFMIIVILNFLMLMFGFMGESKQLDKTVGNMLGFIAFFALYYYIFVTYIQNKKILSNQILFWVFVVFWSLYGVSYWFDEKNKNISYNILDLFSKCFVGIGMWAYLTGVFVV